ncbi:MAG: NAD(P)/FAD-dependent oxidoreductase [Halanaeroarchaeum sp.]
MQPVVVVGGGIVGTSVAAHLAARDVPVHLMERDSLGAGTTAASVAIFLWHQEDPTPVEHRLRERSWETYGPLVADETLSFERIGTVETARTDAEVAHLEHLEAELGEYGVETEWLTDGLRDHGLDPDAFAAGLHVPADGYLDPGEIVQVFAERARQHGATVETGVAVEDVVVADGAVVGVETERGRVDASAVVNAAGPWAPAIDAMVGVSVPLRHTRGPILVLQRDTPFDLPFVLLEDDLYFREESTNQAFAGRFATDFEAASVLDPDGAHGIDHAFRVDVADVIERAVPRLRDAEIVADWVGIRTVTPDGRPFVGETDVEGYHVATGMSGLGVTRSPAVGDLLGGMIAGEDVDPEFAAYLAPDRLE